MAEPRMEKKSGNWPNTTRSRISAKKMLESA